MQYYPVILLILLLGFLLPGCISSLADTEQSFPGQDDINITTFGDTGIPFIHTLVVEPDDGKSMILSMINNARTNLTLTIYEINDPDIIKALALAEKRGVSVRVLYNNNSFASMNKTNPNHGAIINLSLAGAEVKPASTVFTVTHQKTLTADESESCIMTFNLEPGYFNTTRDFGIFTTNTSEVKEVADVFDADWNYQNSTPFIPSLVWSPVNSRTKILGMIEGATKTLDIYIEEINDKQCINALIAAAKRGVTVRVITADMESNGKNKNEPALKILNDRGVEAKAITSLYIHAKMVLADYGEPDQVAFLGSENFGYVSLNQNRELGILITEKPILDRLKAVFLKDWQVPALPEKKMNGKNLEILVRKYLNFYQTDQY